MKKLLLLLFVLPLLVACSKDDDKNETKQDYTSIEVYVEGSEPYLRCIAGYKDGDVFKKLCDVGNVSLSKPSKTIQIKDDISEIYIFGEYMLVSNMIKEPFEITPKTKNVITIKKEAEKIIVDTTDPKMYPLSY